MGELSFDEKFTGIIFGFLNQIFQLANHFNYPRFIFAWDSKKSYRKEICPDYKRKDKKITQDLLELLDTSRPQFTTLRFQILPRIGFVNNFIQTGVEADDIIAMITKSILKPFEDHDQYVIVSVDNDLYQLLSPNVSMFNPKTKKLYTGDDFVKEFRIQPSDWPKVKALAGCDGDNVKGISGVGIKTAIKWFNGEFKEGKMADTISTLSTKTYLKNLPLVILPHGRTTPIRLFEDEFSFKCFEDVCMEYGLKSFLKKGNYEKWKKMLS
jgi:5'-3' exonuclease